jgi:hypothetical protein
VLGEALEAGVTQRIRGIGPSAANSQGVGMALTQVSKTPAMRQFQSPRPKPYDAPGRSPLAGLSQSSQRLLKVFEEQTLPKLVSSGRVVFLEDLSHVVMVMTNVRRNRLEVTPPIRRSDEERGPAPL